MAIRQTLSVICLATIVVPCQCGFFDFLTNLIHPNTNASVADHPLLKKAQGLLDAAKGATNSSHPLEKALAAVTGGSGHSLEELKKFGNVSEWLSKAEKATQDIVVKANKAGCHVGNITDFSEASLKKLTSDCKAIAGETGKETGIVKSSAEAVEEFSDVGPVAGTVGAGHPLAAGSLLLLLLAAGVGLLSAAQRQRPQLTLPTDNSRLMSDGRADSLE